MRKQMGIILTMSLGLAGCFSSNQTSSVTSQVETPIPTESTEDKIHDLVSNMDLKTKVEQMIMPAIETWDGNNFTEMNDTVESMLEEYHFGGIILFASNFVDNDQVINLTQSMQQATVKGGGQPLLIGTDQEGGYITRLTNGTSTIGNMALAATGDTSNATQSAKIISQELEALGLNLDFAPSLDVNSNPANPIIGVRSFSDDPNTVVEYGRAYLAGLKENNVIGTVKHFPGHGDTDTDSHTGLPLIDRSKEEVENQDLVPFKTLIEEGDVDMVMSAHIQFPQIETGTYTSIKDGSTINLPATLSKTWISEILRGEIGFDGVVITDSFQMDAIKENFGTKDSAKLAINAGVNMILMPVVLESEDSINEIETYINDIVDMVNNGDIDESLIDESCFRILMLKEERGILSETYDDSRTQSLLTNADSLVGSEDSHNLEREMGDKAVTVLKNDNNILPYTTTSSSNVVVITKNRAQKNMMDHSFFKLQDEGVIDSNAQVTVINENYGDYYNDCINAINVADVLIVTSIMDAGIQIDPSQSTRISNIEDYIHNAKQQGIPVIAISTGIPYDTALLQEADAIMCIYNPAGASNIDDYYNPISTYGVNLLCASDVIYGKVNPSGKLPVDVPNVENATFTSDILYPRGSGLSW